VTWKTLAASGRYQDAFALIQSRGFERVCGSASTQELVQLGDVARLAGQPAAARRAYVKARSASKVAMAAYGLGLTAFDQERNYPQAARWFRTYLRERPRGGLRREALGRLMEALRRSGDRSGARQVARRYVKEFPDGTHASLARRLIGQ
jgi:TolA-binding protein